MSLLLALLAVVSAPPPIDPDLRCMGVLLANMDKIPAAAQSGVMGGVMYYYGRLDGRYAHYDLEGELRKLAASETVDAVRADLQRCGKEMEEKGGNLQRIGGALQGSAEKAK